MANCSSEKDTLLDQIASLEAKITKLEQENKEQEKYIKFLQNKLRDLGATNSSREEENLTNDDFNEDSEENEEYKDYD